MQLSKAALVCGLLAALAGAAQADTLTPALRKDDPRLATRVTVRAPRILVGELLERLSR